MGAGSDFTCRFFFFSLSLTRTIFPPLLLWKPFAGEKFVAFLGGKRKCRKGMRIQIWHNIGHIAYNRPSGNRLEFIIATASGTNESSSCLVPRVYLSVTKFKSILDMTKGLGGDLRTVILHGAPTMGSVFGWTWLGEKYKGNQLRRKPTTEVVFFCFYLPLFPSLCKTDRCRPSLHT